jgi:beta-lactamase regulating signal transducer with metallopeptidase domain
MTALLLDSALRVSVVTGLALVAIMLLRGRSAAIRHWVLAAATACALALPALQPVVPSWQVAVAIPAPLSRAVEATVPQAGPATSGRPVVRQAAQSSDTWNVFVALGWLWLAGTAFFVGMLMTGFARLAWLASRADTVESLLWQQQLRELSQRYGRARPVQLLQSHHPALLVTWGVRSPKILLPLGADTWPADRIRVVLAHELAHVIRHDWLSQISAEMLRALYWFNPLVWLASRRLREESERACDDAVLEMGVDGPVYATHLLEVAKGFSGYRRAWSPAPAIASPSHLERRVRAMLNARLNRRPLTRLARVAIVIAVVGITLPIAALAQASFSTFSGSVVDPMNGLLPKTVLVLTNTRTQAKYEVRSDASGRFEFVGLPPSDYLLEANLPGFATLRGTVSVTGQDVFQEIRLNVGELEETVTVTAGGGDRPDRPEPREVKKRPLPVCPDALAGGIGGRIRPPVKVRDVRPRYPIGVDDAKDEELVRLNAVIATDGSIKDLQVVEPAHPAFAAAAVEGVRQWGFDETLLNCAPTEVSMRVSVAFRKE